MQHKAVAINMQKRKDGYLESQRWKRRLHRATEDAEEWKEDEQRRAILKSRPFKDDRTAEQKHKDKQRLVSGIMNIPKPKKDRTNGRQHTEFRNLGLFTFGTEYPKEGEGMRKRGYCKFQPHWIQAWSRWRWGGP